MNKEQYNKFLEAVDTICIKCWFTGKDGEDCEICPVRKMCDDFRKKEPTT